ncbi:MAG: RNA-directed DNA polymerase [Alphaproteobacteria bacterium]
MRASFEKAIANVSRHGDTDIFPFPIENHLFFDLRDDTANLLQNIHDDFAEALVRYPPANEGGLAPVNYVGFRWATQLDPLWNLYFLALVISLAENIEAARLPIESKRVFSYRYKWNDETASLFNPDYHWRSFMECSLSYAKEYKYVVVCDISEFYLRLNHHRLENALLHISVGGDIPERIIKFLGNFSNKNSYGLPVGGPAARLLSELVLNQIDRLLQTEGVHFCRFADDFHIFCNSTEEAYACLISLSEKLIRNQGLQLQKSKTRLMTSAEFISTSPLRLDDHDAPDVEGATRARAGGLLALSLRYDPYSANAEENYEALKNEVKKFDIVGLLREELSKSRVHIALARKIVTTIKFLELKQRDDAVVTLIDNAELLYPIFPTVLHVVRAVFVDLSPETQTSVLQKIIALIERQSHVLRVELALAYAIRLLSCRHSPEAEAILEKIYRQASSSALLRRDIILVMAKWRNWYWLSDLRASFRTLSPAERRAFIVASYLLKEEGRHWRRSTAGEFTPFELLVQKWASQKVTRADWGVPL